MYADHVLWYIEQALQLRSFQKLITGKSSFIEVTSYTNIQARKAHSGCHTQCKIQYVWSREMLQIVLAYHLTLTVYSYLFISGDECELVRQIKRSKRDILHQGLLQQEQLLCWSRGSCPAMWARQSQRCWRQSASWGLLCSYCSSYSGSGLLKEAKYIAYQSIS